jgi:hypothetical protein
MQELVPDIVSGNWEGIAAQAKEMEGSYIMKQKLSDEQRKELRQKLPAGFKELDGTFHRLAGMLAHVAEDKHAELVSFYFYKLMDTCTQCHSRYAAERFPSLASEEEQHKH